MQPAADTRNFLRALLIVTGLMTWVALTISTVLFPVAVTPAASWA